jgi:hypothetical protein
VNREVAKTRDVPRGIWAHSESLELPDVIRSLFSLTLLAGVSTRPIYFCSPWISDFPVFENGFGQFSALFPDLADQREILFSDFLVYLCALAEVRLVTKHTDVSHAFLRNSKLKAQHRIQSRFADRHFHEKGILAPHFYLEGSMNITFMGVRVNEEKVLLHTGQGPNGECAISTAYLEFDRRWSRLDAAR